MATTTFTAASLIFINIWLVALVAFGVITSSIVLYVLKTVDGSIRPSMAFSLTCAGVSFIYLTLQCVNVGRVKQGRWHQSWLSKICIQLPRALIVLWMIVTIVGFVSAIRRPLCRNPDAAGEDVATLQADMGCWIFRVLVLLDAVMLMLCFVLFCLLEVNGRYVSLALFHFEYTRATTLSPHRRRNLIASPYGASVETLTCPINSSSVGGSGCMYEKHDFHSKRMLSPSPTYHTFESIKGNSNLWPGSATSNRYDSRHDILSEFPMPLNLTLHDPFPSRRSTSFTADIPFPHPVEMDTRSIYSGAQLLSRPISKLPALPSPARGIPLDLKDAPDPTLTAPMAAKAILDGKSTICPAPQNHEVNMVEPRSRFKSSSALPFEFVPRAHSMVDLASASTTDLTSDTSGSSEFTTHKTPHGYNPSIDTTRRISTSCIHEHPPPAWCPQSLKSAPLSADPAIRRLTDFHPRSRASAIRASRISNMGRRRGSLGAFEFGFPESTVVTPSVSSATINQMMTRTKDVDLSDFSDTSTPLERKRATMIKTHGDVLGTNTNGGGLGSEKNDGSTSLVTTSDLPKTPQTKKEKIMSRGRARNFSISGTQAQSRTAHFSIMPPPLTNTNTNTNTITADNSNAIVKKSRRMTSSCTTTSVGSGLGLTFDDTKGSRKATGMGKKEVGGKHGRNGSRVNLVATAASPESGNGSAKKIVERGRWEVLPR